MHLKTKWLNWLIGKEKAEEAQILTQWKKETEDNIRQLKTVVQPEAYIDGVKSYQEVNVEAAWQKVDKRMDNSVLTTNRLSLTKVAAIFVFVTMSLLALNYFLDSSKVTKEWIAQNEIMETDLNDGSVITLDKNSRLKMLDNRQWKLDGRCFFDVAKNPTEPFKVAMHHGILEVLGTQFVIFTHSDNTTVYVSEGHVRVTYKDRSYNLIANDKLTINAGGISTQKVPQVDAKSWAKNVLVFKDQSLSVVLNTLAIQYNLNLKYAENISDSDNCKINTSFSNLPLAEILEELVLISGLKYQINGKNIVILDFKC